MYEDYIYKSNMGRKPLLTSRKNGEDWQAEASRELAAAVLAQAFEDLASPTKTKYVYAGFFFSDYCKNLFSMTGVEYDPKMIRERIDARPLQKSYYYDCKTKHYMYMFTVKNGYIEEIKSMIDGSLCCLDTGTDREPNYYFPTAMSRLWSHRYTVREGV